MRWLILLTLFLVACGGSSSESFVDDSTEAEATALVLPASCVMVGQLPDPTCTPGAIDPRVNQANIKSTICKSGYTKTVRPSVAYTSALKARQMKLYGFTDSLSAHEEDHLISLELGGAPKDPLNLWPEPQPSPNPKDKIENELHALVCGGKMTLNEAQRRIATDWTKALP